jgi:hypothetical protein
MNMGALHISVAPSLLGVLREENAPTTCRSQTSPLVRLSRSIWRVLSFFYILTESGRACPPRVPWAAANLSRAGYPGARLRCHHEHLAVALLELGKIERTLFVLQYIDAASTSG